MLVDAGQRFLRLVLPPEYGSGDAMMAFALQRLGERMKGKQGMLFFDNLLWQIWPPCRCEYVGQEAHEVVLVFRETASG